MIISLHGNSYDSTMDLPVLVCERNWDNIRHSIHPYRLWRTYGPIDNISGMIIGSAPMLTAIPLFPSCAGHKGLIEYSTPEMSFGGVHILVITV